MAGLRCGARGLESGRAGAAQVKHREGRQDREGIVTHVPPLHDVAIEEVLQILQRQSEEATATTTRISWRRLRERSSNRSAAPPKARKWRPL